MPDNIINSREQYDTWDIFKKDVELNLGHFLPNNLWLQAKPKKPLPWSKLDVKETVLSFKKN